MNINLRKNENGSFFVEGNGIIDFWRGGLARVSVKCDDYGYDEILLRNDALSYLNHLASNQGMRVLREEGQQATIPVRVERGESARVRYLEFPVEILPW